MVGRSEAMRRIYQLVEMAAPTKCRVLISGESGTGKELIARAIHALSPRREQALRRAELRGDSRRAHRERDVRPREGRLHRRGGRPQGDVRERADGGTLFLDEIGDMSLMTQAKLLRVLQEGEVTPVGSTESRPVDVRIVAATSKNLARGDRAGGASARTSTIASTCSPSRVPPLAGAAGGHPGAGRALPAPGQRRERHEAEAPGSRAPSTSWSSSPGRGTCGSCAT